MLWGLSVHPSQQVIGMSNNNSYYYYYAGVRLGDDHQLERNRAAILQHEDETHEKILAHRVKTRSEHAIQLLLQTVDALTKKLEVLNSGDIAGFIKTILTELPFEDSSMLEQAFVEVLTNAVYYGVFDSDGANKHEWEVDIDVPPGQVEVNYGCDDEKLVVGIKDTGGKLDKKKIMFCI